MAKKQTTFLSDVDKNDDNEQGRVSLDVKLPNNNDLVVCKVCGHKNPRNTGMCEMCSNYLFS